MQMKKLGLENLMTPKEAAELMVRKTKVAILTGAGVSMASGVPTFRGQDGFWKNTKSYAGEGDPMKVLTKDFFYQNPMACWEWHYDFLKLMEGK